MASKTHLVIDAGTTYSTTLNLTDDNGDILNLNNFQANAVMKKWYTSTNSVVFNASINVAMGTVTLELDANVTSTIVPGRYVYDVDLTDLGANTVSRVVEGIITVTPSVTAIRNATPSNSIFTNTTPLI